jgi:hypothetical protein
MLYDPNSPSDIEKANERLRQLIERKEPFEIVSRKQMIKRSTDQNSYLHCIIAYFASQTGYTAEWVKQNYYKLHCNRDIYLVRKEDPLIGEHKEVRSSASLSIEEMSLSIKRFKFYAAEEAGILLPDATEEQMLQAWKEIKCSEEYL